MPVFANQYNFMGAPLETFGVGATNFSEEKTAEGENNSKKANPKLGVEAVATMNNVPVEDKEEVFGYEMNNETNNEMSYEEQLEQKTINMTIEEGDEDGKKVNMRIFRNFGKYKVEPNNDKEINYIVQTKIPEIMNLYNIEILNKTNKAETIQKQVNDLNTQIYEMEIEQAILNRDRDRFETKLMRSKNTLLEPSGEPSRTFDYMMKKNIETVVKEALSGMNMTEAQLLEIQNKLLQRLKIPPPMFGDEDYPQNIEKFDGSLNPSNLNISNNQMMNNAVQESESILNVNLLLKSLLFACLFYILSHESSVKMVKKVVGKMKPDMFNLVMLAVFALAYYVISMFI